MTGLIAAGVATVVVICAADVLAPRLRTASPLVLVILGLAVSLIPGFPSFHLDPELVLEGVLPPLLYGAAVAMPAMSFRREFSAVSGLAVTLVVLSSVALGLVFWLLVPGVSFLWGVALGAIISPTDAVATSLIKGRGVPGRVVTILEGESLLNDATALVLLRTAIASTATAFSLWGALGSFAWSVLVAVAIGALVGFANFKIRSRISDPAVTTALSFTLPFVASVPTEMLHGSGLVAAVVAGLITGFRGPRMLPPSHRLTSSVTWSSIQLLLEGLVFLTMGLQLRSVLEQLSRESVGILAGIALAVLALVVTLVVRGAWMAPLLWQVHRRERRYEHVSPRIEEMQARLADSENEVLRRPRGVGGGRELTEAELERFATRLRRASADIGYLRREGLGPRESTVLVWAGMRGAVTVAAAQTLPEETPHRALLVFVAFAVATLSLLVQGGTIGAVVARLFPGGPSEAEQRHQREQHEAILSLLDAAAAQVEADLPESVPRRDRELAILRAQRSTVLDARDDGLFDAEALDHALSAVDTSEIALEMRGGPGT